MWVERKDVSLTECYWLTDPGPAEQNVLWVHILLHLLHRTEPWWFSVPPLYIPASRS